MCRLKAPDTNHSCMQYNTSRRSKFGNAYDFSKPFSSANACAESNDLEATATSCRLNYKASGGKKVADEQHDSLKIVRAHAERQVEHAHFAADR